MEKVEKIECVVHGKVLKLVPEAFKIAEKYFGAIRSSEMKVNKPIELSKPILIPKPIEIKKPVIDKPIEPAKESKAEVMANEVVDPIINKVPAKKKVVKKEKK